ncbi:HesB/IscA family protein [Methylocystis bryophila]|uniref:Fe-S cluster assembly scaffold SufA n=1 Tax=Methylocystis bryophila TaxID=655015 RepID=A0A1W6MSX7_9HYPH|nr:iron-sulfur cluster assembly accessory protein [Methylocystis bryophila]ARN80599.1 Fe-S cluster assembly scaffold SufA [Methylocystis bryophila]BDV40652.1 Fe-S cluster assembly scaffold SufA [Methylocystis bryophila]
MNLAAPAVIALSDAAVDRVRSLTAKAQSPEAGLRISVEKGGCAGMSYKMELAQPEPGDEIVEQAGARVIVDAKAVLYLLGARMDVKTDRFSSSFVFENPNQTASCGCGESVSLTPAAAPLA